MGQYSFPRSAPEEQGIPSASIASFLAALEEQGLEAHSFMVLRNGYVVSEGWWEPYAAHIPHSLYSTTKTFTATAVGLAVQEGLLALDDKVASYFPDELPEQPSDKLLRMRVKDLLMMGTGQPEDTMPNGTENWIAGFLSKPVEAEPGTRFAYHNGASNMLAAIIRRVSGETVHQFLKPRLFAHLGIEGERWDLLPDGSVPGGFGLRATTEDIAKLGQLYLQKGMWNGKRILSEQWVEEATSKQIDNGPSPNPDWAAGYGYQIWRCHRDDAYRFIGMFNQLCLVLPNHNALVVMTSGLSDEKAVLETIWEHLVPAMQDRPLEPDPEASLRLSAYIGGLSLLPDELEPVDFTGLPADGRTYKLEDNPIRWSSVSFKADGGRLTYTAETVNGTQRATLLPGQRSYGEFDREPVLLTCARPDDDALCVTAYLISAPFRWTMTFRFQGDELAMTVVSNVGRNEPLVISGKRMHDMPVTD